jgi:type IV pilus assembly protein PilW
VTRPRYPSSPRRERGVGLVEILIGVLLGLIGSVAIFQILNVASQSSRTTSDQADAQMAGSLAVYRMERDLQLGGFGTARIGTDLIGCDVAFARDGVAGTFALAPINATFGAAGAAGFSGASDELHMVLGAAPNSIGSVALTATDAAASTLASRAGFAVGDVALFMQASGTPRRCELRTITLRGGGAGEVGHAGGAGRFASARVFGVNDLVTNLGGTLRVLTYRLDAATQRLMLVDRLLPNAAPVEAASGVVDFQVQLGVDGLAGAAGVNNRIEDDEWIDTAGAVLTNEQLARVIAVRVALLVQGTHYSKDEITNAEPTWGGATKFTMPAGAEWKHFRYRVYEATTSLRNVLWNRAGT